ncbi:MAG: gfo/Idh/MocA family oxidoreductase [Bacteroidetes bacterium]|nr:MAG: gfo/Idh/MocA family oxidoreductase [Bacteroidota bacterium]
MKKKSSQASRRRFVKRLAGGALAAGAAPQLFAQSSASQILPWDKYQARVSANERVGLGVIGLGIMGFNNLNTALQVPGVELVAVCDLYQGRLQRARELHAGKDLFTTRDYRELLARADVDAVIVATSDHWHDHITIAALEAGKHVYCEKPMVQHLDEGHAVLAAERKSGKVLQVGSQRVSSILTAKAQELYQAGEIGQLILVEAWTDRQSALGAWQYSIPTDASPETVDWEAYLGDAPKRPFDAKRFFRWRNYQDYGTGVPGDLYVHLLSGLHVITGSHGPERAIASGGLRYWDDGRDVPDVVLSVYDYPENDQHPAFNAQLRVNFIDGGGGGNVTRLVGTEGTMTLGWSGVTIKRSKMPANPGYGGWDSFFTFSEKEQAAYEAWYKETYPDRPQVQGPAELTYSAPEGYSDHYDHWAGFIQAVREGGKVVEDGAFGFRAAAAALLTNVSYAEKKAVKWDPEAMKRVK